MQRILLAVDLREPVSMTNAVVSMVNQLGARLYVLHVMQSFPSQSIVNVDPLSGMDDYSAYTLFDPEIECELEQAEETAFQRFIRERFHIPVHTVLREGDPSTTIIEDAALLDANLLIVGKRRHSPLERWILGDVARDVLELAARPVLFYPIDNGNI